MNELITDYLQDHLNYEDVEIKSTHIRLNEITFKVSFTDKGDRNKIITIENKTIWDVLAFVQSDK